MTASSSQHRACLVAADPWSRSWLYDGGRRLAFGVAAHAHGELALIEEGDATYVIGRRVVQVSAGQLAWIPPGFEHRTSFGTRVRALALGVPIADDELRESGLGEVAVWSGQPALQALVRDVADPRCRSEADARIAIAAARDTLFARLVERRDDPPATVDARCVRRVIDRIHAELGEPLTIETLAATAGLSRFHFSRVFRDATGQSPYQYLLEARLQAARALVRASPRSMADIALAAGFSDASRFAQMFRRRWGLSPGAMRADSRVPQLGASAPA